MENPKRTPAAIAGAGTSVSVGVLSAYLTVPHLPGPLQAPPDSDASVHGLLMALVAGVVAAGARGAGELIGSHLPGRK